MLKLKKPTKISLGGQVAEIIRKSILTGSLKPGQRLYEDAIASEMGVSRAPVREALRFLEREGVVTYLPNKGVYVRTVSAKDISEIFTLRSVMEGLAAKLTTGEITEEEQAQLEKICEELEQAASNEDEDALIQLDLKFHKLLVKFSRHSFLQEVFSTMINLVTMYLRVDAEVLKLKQGLMYSAVEHRDILAAIKNGEGEKAEELMRKHINESGRMILEYLEN